LDTEAKIKAHRRAGFAPELGRVLTPQEWEKLKQCLIDNPQMRLVRHELYKGKAFFQYAIKSKGGMFWAKKEQLTEYNRRRKTTTPALRVFKKAARNSFEARFRKWVNRNTSGAKSRGIPNTLSPDELKDMYGAPCFYCGQSPDNDKSWGIDRLHNNIGYHYDNCVPCCRVCNLAKGTGSFEEFVEHTKKIVANIGHTTT
jgi:hypothetical protein